MNEILASIYETGGFEKTASPINDGEQMTLSDLAVMLIVDGDEDEADLTKIASAHGPVLDELVAFDRAGRAIAHHEFSDMEKAAFAGDPEALEQFFAAEGEQEVDEKEYLKQSIRDEINRRVNG